MLLSSLQHIDTLVFLVISLIVAITIHEFSHAWMATRLGDGTAKYLGRLTLNPLAHLDIVGTILIFLVGFGWGKPVPYNPAHVARGKFGEMLIAIAGPISNIIVAFIAALPGRIFLINHQALPTGQIYTFLAVLVTLNIFLAAFNLIPIPPLDGSKILYLILDWLNVRQETVLWLEQTGPYLLLVLIFVDNIFGFSILSWLLEPVIVIIQWIVGSSTLPF
jgi:Zn-dependent protease